MSQQRHLRWYRRYLHLFIGYEGDGFNRTDMDDVPIAISDLSLKPTVMPTPHVRTLTVPTNVLVMTVITATVLTAKTQMNAPLLVQLGNPMVSPINSMVLICVTSMPLAVIPMAIIHVLVMKVSKATVLPAKILMNALIQLGDKLLRMTVT